MMSEKRNLPELRFQKFLDSWRCKTIGDYYKHLRTGMTPSRSKPNFFTGEIPWITSGELSYNLITNTKEKITKEAVQQTRLKLYHPNTFFIAITGLEAPGTRGRCAINGVVAATNQSCLAFEEVPEINQKFLYFWYLKFGVPLYYKFAQGTKQESFNNKIVEAFDFYVPSLPEQQKIAEFLTAVDKRIALLEQKKEKLESYKKGVMQQIFSQKLRFKQDDGSEFPDWEEKKLGKVAKIYDGTHQTPKYVDQGIPFYSVEHVTANQFKKTKYISEKVFEAENKRVKLEKGDLLMTKIGSIGVVRIIDWDVKASFYVSLALLKVSSKVDSQYLSFCISETSFQRELWKRTIHVAFPQKINLGEIGECKVLLPPLNEQKKIAKFLTGIGITLENLNQQITQTQTWKKGLLQKMFV
jgi:type I restriction enzyme, S subunit